MPLDQFLGPACGLDFSSKGADEAITAADLEKYSALVQESDIALFYTGWSDKHWSSDPYLYRFPFLSSDARGGS